MRFPISRLLDTLVERLYPLAVNKRRQKPVGEVKDNDDMPWRAAVGGMWHEIGNLQFAFLRREGLKPRHKLLDIGCGSLRGGVHFVGLLQSGNYFGIDKQQWLLDAGLIELKNARLSHKRVFLVCRDDFDFSVFAVKFDYAIAQSVFTHLLPGDILRCLENVGRVLYPSGRFYATFFEDPDGRHREVSMVHFPGCVTTYPHQDPFHYEFALFEELARKASLQVRYIGDWNHPRGQMMMVFTPATT